MRTPSPTVVDFESFAIEGRPDYPPIPTSVSIKRFGKPAKYYAWGHLSGNNCAWSDAKEALKEAWRCKDGVLFHNAKFDLAAAEKHFDLALPPWNRVHDTMFLGFLDDPNQKELGLKPMAERILGWKPEERDALADWLVENQPVPGVRITSSASNQSKAPYGAFIPFAPGDDVVGPYANGDVERTEALFAKLWQSVVAERGMGAAYDRERRLLPVLMRMERRGVRVDVNRLRSDVATYRAWWGRVDAYLRKRLGATEDLNLDSGAQVMAALVASGLIDEAKVPRTPTGKLKSDEEAMALVKDAAVGALFAYRAKLKMCVVTFMENWLATAEKSGGFIYADWHQTRGADGGGARTGRLSSSPNLQNISKEFPPIWRSDAGRIEDAAERKTFAAKAPTLPRELKGLPSLPLVRSYVVPYRDGHILVDRDYSQQEPRILAHFEGGALTKQYQENPWIDYHDNAKVHLERVLGKTFNRKHVKNTNLGIIYGQGIGSVAAKNGSTVDEAKEVRDAILKLYPGLREMSREMKRKAAAREPLITWGGRKCLCEDPKIVDGKVMTFEYKMINTLIQGSAGDCTKEAMIRFDEEVLRRGKDWFLLASIHDELLVSAPIDEVDEAMTCLKEAMESVEFDVLILSEGDVGSNWAELKKYDKKGEKVCPF